MVLLHIIFGIFTFIGALGLGAAFRDSFTELPTPKKVAITLSYVGATGSTVLGFTPATRNPFVSATTAVLVVALLAALFKKNSKEASK